MRSDIASMAISFQDEIINATVSVGVAIINPADARYEDLISNTDIALYKAKNAGRNKVFAINEFV